MIEMYNDRMNYEFRELEWDTSYFGVECARIDIVGSLTDKDEDEILSILRKYSFVTIFSSPNNPSNNKFLGEYTKAYLTDINVQLNKKITDSKTINNTNIKINNNHNYNEEIELLANNMFLNSRFLNDSNISKEKANGVYKNWILNSFDKDNKYFVTYQINNKVLGFILFNLKDNYATIELIAVNGNHSRAGIGKSMMLGLEGFCYDNGVESIVVGTQIENINAINFYNKCGYKVSDIRYIYHFWG